MELMEFTLFRGLFQLNYQSAIIAIILLVFICTNRTFPKNILSYFFMACIMGIVLTIADNIRYLTALKDQPTVLRYWSSAIGYALRPIIVYFIFEVSGRNQNKPSAWFCIPVYINIAVSLISIPTGVMFSFTENNALVHGPLGYVCHITSLSYSCLIMNNSLKLYKSNKRETVVISVIIIFAAFAAALEHFFKFSMILSQTIMIGIVFYFLFLNVQVHKRDTLTNLMNRRCFYLDLKRFLNRKVIILSMDLNDLKKWNDNYGHSAGDTALKTCVDFMYDTFPKARLYRTGGDEFMALFFNSTKEQISECVRHFHRRLEATPYRVACGVAEFIPGDDIEKIISFSDREMYKNKKALKSINIEFEQMN